MKSIKLLSILLVVFLLFPFANIEAAAQLPLEDSLYWENLNASDATNLLRSSQNSDGDSFIFVFYRDTCFYSKTFVPLFAEYAQENNIKLYGLNDNDYPIFFEWSKYVSDSTITFPLVIAYNYESDTLLAEHSVHSKEEFHELLNEAGFNTTLFDHTSIDSPTQLPQVTPVPSIVTSFYDVSEDSPIFHAVNSLVENQIITGYEDGSFKPQNPISRAEAATIIARAGNLSGGNVPSIYSDVSNSHWAKNHIMAATKANILNGMGNGLFMPNENVTYAQIIKMLVCMYGKEQDALNQGGWPLGYIEVAYQHDIIDYSIYRECVYFQKANQSASRGDVALFTYNTLLLNEKRNLTVDGTTYSLGMSASALGTPDEVLPSFYDFTWYVYGTDTYKDFYAAGISDGIVVALAASGPGFEYLSYRCGNSFMNSTHLPPNLYTDENDSYIAHGVFILEDGYEKIISQSPQAIAGESKMNFHFTNAFRAYHGVRILKWNDPAATAATLHSQDMAINDYFSHTSLDGTPFSDRLEEQNIRWSYCGENICGGYTNGFFAYNGWVNSSGHRRNMLADHSYLGVGGGYDANSSYGLYFTQDFFR